MRLEKKDLMSTINSNSEAAIFGRLLQREKHDLSPDLAEYILNLGFAEDDRDRINELAAHAHTLFSKKGSLLTSYTFAATITA
jgi:hypothetical protein